MSLWLRENRVNSPIWLDSTQFLKCLLISAPCITTAYSNDLFTYLSPYVIFFILFPHLLKLALKFLCHRNELLACFYSYKDFCNYIGPTQICAVPFPCNVTSSMRRRGRGYYFAYHVKVILCFILQRI